MAKGTRPSGKPSLSYNYIKSSLPSYKNSAGMIDAVNYLTENYSPVNSSDFMYGDDGAKALTEYARQLKKDYSKEYKNAMQTLKNYNSGKVMTTNTGHESSEVKQYVQAFEKAGLTKNANTAGRQKMSIDEARRFGVIPTYTPEQVNAVLSQYIKKRK